METVADDPAANVLTVPIAKVGCEPFAPLGMLKAIVRLDGGPLRLAVALSVEGTEDALTLDMVAGVPSFPGFPFAPFGMLKVNVRAEGVPPRVTEAGSVEGTEDAVTLDICASVPGVPFAPLGILKANVRFEGVPPRLTEG